MLAGSSCPQATLQVPSWQSAAQVCGGAQVTVQATRSCQVQQCALGTSYVALGNSDGSTTPPSGAVSPVSPSWSGPCFHRQAYA
ncbi:MAG TPA: hypothetical protein VFE93_09650, partial [Myxococcaceae bacterium]|nr:hypothetical protein [Myxococcaceae bacterium]